MRIRIPLYQKISLITFGLFLAVVLLEAGLRLGGFVLTSLQEYRNLQSIRHKGAYRIMCLGESTTAAQYPPYLEEIMNQHHTGIRFSVIDKGEGGTRTESILRKLEFNLAKYNPDMVITMMGINDYGAHIPYEAASASKIVTFLKSFRTYKLTRLLWLHILTKAREARQYPGKIQSHILVGGLEEAHAEQASSDSTEDAFKRAIELNPLNEEAYIGLGQLYWLQGKFPQAEDAFKKAVEFDPKNDKVRIELGWLYSEQAKFSQAEDAFKKAIALNPKNDKARMGLGWLYWQQGNFSQAEELLKKAIELNPENDRAYGDRAYGALSVLYEEMGKSEQARAYARRANRLRLEQYNPVTVHSYREIKAILEKRGVRLVCVQYPLRSIEPLKRIFEDNKEGVVFVDNERVFKDAIRKDGYHTYFKDIFGGDFGHCTAKGNRLLAENIANAILKELFHK